MKRKIEILFNAFSWGATLGTLAVLFGFLAFLGVKGYQAFNQRLFFGDVRPWEALTGVLPVTDGLWPACVGTIYLVLLASLMAVPLGVASGVYLAQFASGSWKGLFSFAVDLLAGIPSILMGLFGFALIIFLRKTLMPQANTGLLLATGCLALLALPYLIMMTRTSLEGLPDSLKLTGLSLGFTPWQNLVQVLLPAASRGILSGIILTVGRAAEDTAVILLTGVVANAGVPGGLTDKFEALPFQIYYLTAEHRNAAELSQAFGAAAVLLAITGILFLGAHWLHRTLEKKWDRRI